MRAVIQRVRKASVEIEGEIVGSIGQGFLILLGIHRNDTNADISWMIDKIINLRIFEKENGKFDKSLLDINGGLLIVSQFTLYGDCSKGRRPSFSEAMEVSRANVLFELFIEKAKEKVSQVKTGIFQTSMNVSLTNEGPVTVILDSKKRDII
jgi:D-tyrosyl-tRNA(Tyr) deacylase